MIRTTGMIRRISRINSKSKNVSSDNMYSNYFNEQSILRTSQLMHMRHFVYDKSIKDMTLHLHVYCLIQLSARPSHMKHK